MSAFTYTLENIISYKIKGDFRSGLDFRQFEILCNITLLSGVKLDIDLFDVDFMDSETYRFVYELDKKNHTIRWDDSSHVWKRYKDWVGNK